MASDQKLTRKHLSASNSMLLKDYLIKMDDLSSCSSNGFISFPRRQCCSTTVRYLIQKPNNKTSGASRSTWTPTNNVRRSRSYKAASSAISLLKKVSGAVVNAVKVISFPSVNSPSPPLVYGQSNKNEYSSSTETVSLSTRKLLLRRRFWNKLLVVKEDEGMDNQRRRLFSEFLQERERASDHDDQILPQPESHIDNENNNNISIITTSSTREAASGRVSVSDSSMGSSSDGWEESDFTLRSSGSGNYSDTSSDNNDIALKASNVNSKSASPEKDVAGSKRMEEFTAEAVTTTSPTCSMTTAKDWPTEEKDQFSPVSVLDCPFKLDEGDRSGSPFHLNYHSHLAQMQHELRARFESHTSLEPLDLEKRFSSVLSVSDGPSESNDQLSSVSCLQEGNYKYAAAFESKGEYETAAEEKARELVNLFKRKLPSSCGNLMVKEDDLLFDYFRDNVIIGKERSVVLMKVAEAWINGEPQEEVYSGWETHKGRSAYIREMDKTGGWKEQYYEQKRDLAGELEIEVLTFLVNELAADLLQ